MSYKDLHALREQRAYFQRDATSPLITRLLAMGQNERYRAVDDPLDEPSAAEKRTLVAISNAACVVEKEVFKHHGKWRGPVMKDSWGALPSSPVDRVDVGISAWTANLRGGPPRKKLS